MIDLVCLHHVSFAIKDLKASRRFFGEVLGLEEIDRPNFKFAGAWYALGDRALHLIENPEVGSDAAAHLSQADHMALQVKSVDKVADALEAEGVEYQRGTNDVLGFQQVFCADPDGHTIEFIRPMN